MPPIKGLIFSNKKRQATPMLALAITRRAVTLTKIPFLILSFDSAFRSTRYSKAMNPRNSPSYRLLPIKAAFNQHEITLKQYFYILWSKHENLGRYQQPKNADRSDR